jgi:topoisomerase-4 subunit A
MAEVVYAKVKGVQKDNQIVNLDEFIAVKGIKALGNQLTTDKIKQINMLDSLPYEEILDEPEAIVSDETDAKDIQDFNIELDDDGQITLSLE